MTWFVSIIYTTYSFKRQEIYGVILTYSDNKSIIIIRLEASRTQT